MPTTDAHPAVTKVQDYLAQRGVAAEITWLDDAVTTAQAAAEALGAEVGQIANSLVFTLDEQPVLVLTSGAHRVDTDWLGEQLGGTFGRASKETVRAATGQAIGGVAPVGHPAPVTTYVDTALSRYSRVWAAAGHPRTVFATSYAELLCLTEGTATEVTPDDEEAS